MTLLSIQALHVAHGPTPVLHGLDLAIDAGEAVAVLGANGAGKSTLMKAIIGLLRPSSGAILLDGRAITALPADRRARLGIGYCPEGRRVFPGMTVLENLQVACWADARTRARRTDAMFALFPNLADRRAALAWTLSGGQQQMLAIARSLMDAPRLLLLDEPSLGLSPLLAAEVLGRIPAIAAGGTAVLLAEQNAARALQVCRRAVVLRLGRIVAAADSAALAGTDALQAAFLGG